MSTDQSVVPQEARAGAEMHGTDRPLADLYQTALIDLDGVVYRGSAAVPFAAHALARWREYGLRTVFLTNNASRTPGQVAELLSGLGISTTPADVVTSAQVAAGLAADAVPRGSRVLIVGGVATEIAVAERGLAPVRSAADAPAAVVQGFAPEVDWRQLAEATYAVDRGIPWFATNTDLVVPRGPGNAPGNGTLINAIRTVTKRDPMVGGKPHPPMYAEAFRRGPGPYLMVGDGLETDIEGAHGKGLDSLLVLTGVTSIGELAAAPAHRRPTFLAADLRGLLGSQPVIRQERHLSWQCGAWTASAANSVIALQRAALSPLADAADLADGARALCQAAWDRADAGVQASAEHAASLVAGELERLKQTYSANHIKLPGKINRAEIRREGTPTTCASAANEIAREAEEVLYPMEIECPFSLYGKEFKRNPYPTYVRLREAGPVHQVEFPSGVVGWLVTGYAAARGTLADPRLGKDHSLGNDAWRKLAAIMPEPQHSALQVHLLHQDPPKHTLMRRLALDALAPRRVIEMRNQFEKIAHELLDQVAGAGSADLVQSFGIPFAFRVLSEVIGLPVEYQLRFDRAWCKVVQPVGPRDPRRSAYIGLLTGLERYIDEVIAHKRKHPEEDLLTSLAHASDRGEITEAEVSSSVFQLLVAGQEPVTNQISTALIALLTHPDQFAQLRDDPALLPQAVEELYRFDGSFELTTWRFFAEPSRLCGTEIPAGDSVIVSLSAANRDPEQFREPDELDFTRSPNPHLGFGHGIHFCPGATLARLELEIALATISQRLPNLRLAVPEGDLSWIPAVLGRGTESLPVTFTPSH